MHTRKAGTGNNWQLVTKCSVVSRDDSANVNEKQCAKQSVILLFSSIQFKISESKFNEGTNKDYKSAQKRKIDTLDILIYHWQNDHIMSNQIQGYRYSSYF